MNAKNSVGDFMKQLLFSLVFAATLTAAAAPTPASHKHGDDHTPDVCSATDAKVCAHIGHMTALKEKTETSFLVHIMAPKTVSNFTMDLWMPEHGHSTNDPIVVTPDSPNKFKVTKANFSMPGKWVARLSFDVDKINHKIEIPLEVSK
jgi:hypothetical protein